MTYIGNKHLCLVCISGEGKQQADILKNSRVVARTLLRQSSIII
jgi:hypothetical protein